MKRLKTAKKSLRNAEEKLTKEYFDPNILVYTQDQFLKMKEALLGLRIRTPS